MGWILIPLSLVMEVGILPAFVYAFLWNQRDTRHYYEGPETLDVKAFVQKFQLSEALVEDALVTLVRTGYLVKWQRDASSVPGYSFTTKLNPDRNRHGLGS